MILSIPSRFDKMKALYEKLMRQVGDKEVEILCIIDNKKRTIGDKRNDVLTMSRGEYVAFIDDDDDVTDDYVGSILKAIEESKNTVCGGADVIVFNELATINNGNPFTVRTGIEYVNEKSRSINGKYIDIKRIPWHWCAWRAELAKTERIPDVSWGEDAKWCERLHAKTKTQYRINRILRFYKYDKNTSEAGK